MKLFVVILVRGGFKGIFNKNIKLLGGKFLIYYIIEVVREVFVDEDIIVFIDSEWIKEVVEVIGLKVFFLWLVYLAIDIVGIYEVLLYVLDFVE